MNGLKIFLDGLEQHLRRFLDALKARTTARKGAPLVYKILFKRLPITFLTFAKAKTLRKMNKMFLGVTTNATLRKSLTSTVISKK